MENNMDKHKRTKKILKIVGILMIIAAIVCIVFGFISFSNALGGSEPPNLFFLLMIGFPLLVVGIFLTLMGCQKEIARYIKNESVPIFNEMGQEIKPGVSGITKAVKDGLNSDENSQIVCECGQYNDKDSLYCSACGRALKKTCPMCGNGLEQKDKFCSKCGYKVEDK